MVYSLLSIQYLSSTPLQVISWDDVFGNDNQGIDTTLQRQLLRSTVQHPLSVSYPPAIAYRRSFLKMLLSRLESLQVEIIDDIYKEYTALLASPDTNESFCWKTYIMPDSCSIALRESTNIVSQGTTGLCTWPAAFHFTEWVMENSSRLRDKRILELGSGLGFAGLATWKVCRPSLFIFSDCHDAVLWLLSHNISTNIAEDMKNSFTTSSSAADSDLFQTCCHLKTESNQLNEDQSDTNQRLVPCSIHDSFLCEQQSTSFTRWKYNQLNVFLMELNWSTVTKEELATFSDDIDVVIATDVIYDVTVLPHFLHVLSVLLKTGPDKVGYVCSTIRNDDTYQLFLSLCTENNLKWTRMNKPSERLMFGKQQDNIEIVMIHSS